MEKAFGRNRLSERFTFGDLVHQASISVRPGQTGLPVPWSSIHCRKATWGSRLQEIHWGARSHLRASTAEVIGRGGCRAYVSS